MDEDACYARLVAVLHPDGLVCPRCGGARFGVHRGHRAPALDDRGRDCRRVFDAFTGTALEDQPPPFGFAADPAGLRPVGLDGAAGTRAGLRRIKLLGLRHKLRGHAAAGLDPAPLPDKASRIATRRIRRANKQRGHGTFANDRPPVAATIGRDSGRACLHVVGNSDRRTLEGLVMATTVPGATLNTDEWRACGRVAELGRGHATVSHGVGEWARDGVREVHVDTIEGTWTGLRNFLRPFRGVSKW